MRIAVCFRGAMPQKKPGKFNGSTSTSSAEYLDISQCLESQVGNLFSALEQGFTVDYYLHSWNTEALEAVSRHLSLERYKIDSQDAFRDAITRLTLIARANRARALLGDRSDIFKRLALYSYLLLSNNGNTTGRVWGIVSQSFTISKSLELAVEKDVDYVAYLSIRPDLILKKRFSQQELQGMITKIKSYFITEQIPAPPAYVKQQDSHGDCFMLMNEEIARKISRLPYLAIEGSEMRSHALLSHVVEDSGCKTLQIKGLEQNQTLLIARKVMIDNQLEFTKQPRSWLKRVRRLTTSSVLSSLLRRIADPGNYLDSQSGAL